MPFSTTVANQLLNWTLGKGSASLTTINQVWIGLCTNEPEDGNFQEVTGDTYERVLIGQSGEMYPDVLGTASDRTIKNTKQINWTKAKVNWSTIKGFGLFSSKTGGSPHFYGSLEEPLNVEAGAVALFDPEAFQISFPTKDTSVASASAE